MTSSVDKELAAFSKAQLSAAAALLDEGMGWSSSEARSESGQEPGLYSDPSAGPTASTTGPPPTRRVRHSPDRTSARGRLHELTDHPLTSWYLMLSLSGILLILDLLIILSTSLGPFLRSERPFNTLKDELLYAAVGIIGFSAVSQLSIRKIRSTSFAVLLGAIFLLIGVLFYHAGLAGGHGLFEFQGFTFAPAEFIGLPILVWAAHVLAARRSTLRSPRALLVPVAPAFLLSTALVSLQPDFPSSAALAVIFLAVLWFGGAPGWVFAIVLSVAVAYIAVYSLILSGQQRPSVFYSNWLHQAGGLTQLSQGVIFCGSILLCLLLALTGLRISRRNVDPFIKIAAAASTIWLIGQVGINVGCSIAVLPSTRLTWPTVATGGTGMFITLCAFGLLTNFARREPEAAAAFASRSPGLSMLWFSSGRARMSPSPSAGAITVPSPAVPKPEGRRSSSMDPRRGEPPRDMRSPAHRPRLKGRPASSPTATRRAKGATLRKADDEKQ